jgi:tripartite-type tricarboxylate transporter receptor subunit TctC
MTQTAENLEWNRRRILALGAATVAAGPLSAWSSASFANRPVRLVVPFAAGGGVDNLARLMGIQLSQHWGQPVIVENKPGAAGLIAGESVSKATPDGHTILFGTTSSMLTNRYLYQKMPYDPLRDLTPLVRTCLAPITLVVTADTPAQNLQEFMSWIQANKGKLSFGSYGIGSHGQLALATISRLANAELAHVAYKGETPMIQDMLGGQIKIGMGSLVNLKPHIDAGKLRPLAVTGPLRLPQLPNVPTFIESGYKQDALSIVGWLAIAGPKDMPANVIRDWSIAANLALSHSECQSRMIASGFVPMDNDTPEKFGQQWTQEAPIWGDLLKAAGVQPN